MVDLDRQTCALSRREPDHQRAASEVLDQNMLEHPALQQHFIGQRLDEQAAKAHSHRLGLDTDPSLPKSSGLTASRSLIKMLVFRNSPPCLARHL